VARHPTRPRGSPPIMRPPAPRFFRVTLKSIVWSAGVVTAIAGAIVGVAKSWEYIEPGMPAFRYYVRDRIDTSLSPFKTAQQSQTSILRDLQIENTEGKRSNAANALANWKLERLKTQDPVTQGLIDRQIQEKDNELKKLDSQLKTLNELRSQAQ